MMGQFLTDFVVWGDIIRSILSGAMIGVVGMLMYFAKRRMEHMNERCKLTEMLKVEVLHIAEITQSTSRTRGTFPKYYTLVPSYNIYKGLVNSGNIAIFDVETQKRVHKFYDYGNNHDITVLSENAPDVMTVLENFEKRSKFWKWR